ncbi:hypothetical protein C361_03607 [Cryptococcus neoformans Tu259-1]|uniref:Uncharacterized protein n=1 Tax=Cryptococcus neoformans Tu259-1 TaxID=1230072 RepID=A0A854QCV9_CRYNE|nr:hypothetical protein C353_03307 [Cryptococcus neoformans var. grubii AD1-83a]OXG20633.1 hypothetical protein C361_03607 [Cryptococcus neoformans var. grubii Tu259-1]OXG59367.1 hypothetical protein C354_03243 [Cryptococcus neoformans var. grubii MW-RSA1955]OXG63360.1 hypothetical protein C351_03032 [Cryptococcus neoformans var. grubii c8]OXG63970.1 hypothetical protein C352_03254 [Cryptococcus neoformans var. grubii CHC193]OXH10552.1 hypothetical protein C369_03281 [Cryptococcus neoformans v
MTDPNKPRPKVTSHVSSTPGHSPGTTYKASVRARVTPSAIAASHTTPGAGSRPSLKTTPSSSSLLSHVSASSANTPRTGARSPLPRTPSTPASVPQARVTKPFQPQRSPLTPGFAPSSGNPSSSSASALGVASGTPVVVPRVRAARSALGVSTVPSVSHSSASKGKNKAENSGGSSSGSGGSGSGNGSGSGYDGTNGYGQAPDGQVRRYAVDKTASAVATSTSTDVSVYGTRTRTDSLKSTFSAGGRAPRARVKPQPQPQTQAQTGLQLKSSSQFTSTPSTSSPNSPTRSSLRTVIHAAGTVDTPAPPVRPAGTGAGAGDNTGGGSDTPSPTGDPNPTTSALGIANAYLSSAPWPRPPSPERSSPEHERLPHALPHHLLHHHYHLYIGSSLNSLPLERSRSSTDNLEGTTYTLDVDQAQAQNGNQNKGTHLPPHVPYHLLTHPTASAPTSPTPFAQPQDPEIQPANQGPHPPSPLSSTSTMTTSFTSTTMATKRRTSKPRLPPMILHPSERQQALKEGRKIVGWLGMGGVGVGRGMRIMPGSPEVKTVELPELTPDATGMPALDRKGKEGWEGENGYGNGLYADEQNQERDLGPEEYQYVYENGNENGNGNDDKHECEYDHRYEYDYDNDNDNGERDTTDNGNGKRNAEQKEVTSVLPVAGDRQDSSEEEEEDGERKCLVENEVEAEAGAGTEIEGEGEGGGKEEQEVDEMLGTDAVEAKINRKIADLEISNASLLAINKSLEAAKSKQRAEIGKLRRRLRETLAFPQLGAGASNGSGSGFGLGSNSGLDFGLGLGVGTSTLEDEADHESEFDLNLFLPHEAEMTDPQLDARWSKMEDLVMGMKKAAEEAVRSGEEEGSREGRGRVLGWAEMEEMEEADASFISEGAGERSEEEGTVS